MYMPNDNADLVLLKEYVRFLDEEKLPEISITYLNLLKEEKVNLNDLSPNLSSEEQQSIAAASLREFFQAILTDTFLQNNAIKINTERHGVSNNQREFPKAILLNSIRRRILAELLTDYATDGRTFSSIMNALEKILIINSKKAIQDYIEAQQQALVDRHQFLSQLIAYSVDGIWAINNQMEIMEWNPALERKTNIKREAAIGKSFYEIFPEFKGTEEEQRILRAFKGERIESLSKKIPQSDGWYDIFTLPIYNKKAKINGVLNIIHDISARKEIELKLQQQQQELEETNKMLVEQREELQAANEELNENLEALSKAQNALKENERRLREAQAIAHLGSWEYDIIENKVYWSDEMKKIFGYAPEEPFDYETYLRLLHPEDRERVNSIISTSFQTAEPYSFEHKILQKDGTVRYIMSHGYPTFSTENKLIKLRGTGLDITNLKLAEFENLESQNFIKKVADTTPDVITVFDLKEKKNIYTNKDLFKILGYSSAAQSVIISKGIEGLKEVFHPEDLPAILGLLKSYEEGTVDGIKEIEFRIKHKRGQWLWVLSKYNVFKRDDQGFPIQIIGVSRNITKRKLAEYTLSESEKRLKEAQVMAHLGYWELDVKTKKIYLSEELHAIFKLPKKPYLRLEAILPSVFSEDRQIMQETLQRAITLGQTYTMQYRIVRKNGDIRHLISKGTPFKNEKGVYLIKGITQDITERKVVEQKLKHTYEALKKAHSDLKKSEEALRVLNNELENRVSLRTRELLESNERLLRKNTDLDNFIYTASHDLKVPIANIEGLLNILRKKVEDKLKGNDRIILNMMDESVNRFNITIKDLTQISKVQKDLEEETIEKISIQDVLNDLTSDMAGLIAEKKAKIYVALEVKEIFFTKKNLRSILYNLLNNALKYSSPERLPEISIETQWVEKTDIEEAKSNTAAKAPSKSVIELKVKDNGLGIPENQMHKVFSLFKRYHTAIEGSGIGLYIVKRIMDNSGGKITVESKVDFGTTFKLFFHYFS